MIDSDENGKIDLDRNDLKDIKGKDKITIELEDLPAEESMPKLYPGLSNGGITTDSKDVFNNISSNLLHLAIAGLIGGFLGWGITELLFTDEYDITQTYMQILLEMAFFAATIGGLVGAFLGAAEGFTSKVPQKIYKGIMIGLVFGLIGGAVGGFLGQIIYSITGIAAEENFLLQLFSRSSAWGIVGLFIGLGQGLGSGGGKKTTNGLLGGLVGGLVGGFLFDIIGSVTTTGALSRAVAIPIIGICTGIGIGIVQEIRKEAWFEVLQGATRGKEYILYGSRNIVGSSPKCDIVLVKDADVSSQHAEVYADKNRFFIRELPNTKGIWLGNRKVSNHELKNNDVLHLGDYKLRYREKVTK